VDTLGNQRKLNYALRQSDKQSFIREVTSGLLPPPGYFGLNVAMNKSGYESFGEVLNRGLKALGPDEFEQAANQTDALILDTRLAEEFCRGFIPKSINIGLKGDFAPWVGSLLVDVKLEILLVCRPGEEEEAITRLSRIGFDQVLGYLRGGYETWKTAGKEEDHVNRISADEFSIQWKNSHPHVLDLRREAEFNTGHLEGAENKPLDFINDWFKSSLDAAQPLFCIVPADTAV